MTRRIPKPWGHELIWAETASYAGKILHIEQGKRLSYQFHRIKDETIYVISGVLELTVARGHTFEKMQLSPGESFHIPAGMRHRMHALETCEVVEVSTPHLSDVVRIEDDFGRTSDHG